MTAQVRPDTVRVGGDRACLSCTIVARRVASLGGVRDSIAPASYARVAVSAGGTVVVAPLDAPGVVARYDTLGRLLAASGRAGDGPGEYRIIYLVTHAPGDTVWVFDARDRRVSVTAPDGSFGRSFRLNGLGQNALRLRNGDLVLAGDIYAPASLGHPLHVLAPSGDVRRSFGREGPMPDGGRYDSRELGGRGYRSLGQASGGRFWAAHALKYQVDEWTPGGALVRVVERQVDWFPPSDRQTDPYSERPSPRLQVAYMDAHDRLWVAISVPDSEWKNPGARNERDLNRISPDELWDTVVEVLDVRTGSLVASRRFAEALDGSVGNEFWAHRRQGTLGEVYVDLLRLQLQGTGADDRSR